MQRRSVRKIKKEWQKADFYDYNLLSVVIVLICFGLLMLYSASSYEAAMQWNDDMYYFRHQALISLLSVVVAFLISRMDYHLFLRWSPFLFVLSLVLMAMVKYSRFGVEAGGSKRWLNFGIQFQPSEIAKIALILFLSYIILKIEEQINSTKSVICLLLLGGIQAVGAYYFT